MMSGAPATLAAALALVWPAAAQIELPDEAFDHDPARPAAGRWLGEVQGRRAGYAVLAIDQDGSGAWTARVTTLLLMAMNKPAEDVRIDGRDVALTVRAGGAMLRLEGRVSADGQRLEGTTTNARGIEGTFELARTIRPAQTEAPLALSGQVRLPTAQTLDLSIVIGPTPGGNWVGEISIPAQGVKAFPLVAVRRDGEAFTATLPGPPDAVIEGSFDDDGATFTGHMKQAGFSMPLELSRKGGVAMAGPSRPQHPEPPFPYRVEDFSVRHPGGYALAGTLTVPRGAGPHPAAVLISGSGQQDRDETIFGHKPFLVIADFLTRHGIAVARYDDRGVGESTGVETLADATTEGFASDAAAVVRWLRGADGIDPGRIGLIGHSEGGIIAPMIAQRDEHIAFVVLMAGTAVPGREILLLQSRLGHKVLGASAESLDEMKRLHGRLIDLIVDDAEPERVREAIRALSVAQLRAGGGQAAEGEGLDAVVEAELQRSMSPWMRFFLTYDPAPALRRLRCPVLALNGTLDLQVWHEQNLPVIEQAVEQGGGEITVKRYRGLNHLFQPARTGGIAEYGRIETTLDEAVLEDLVAWINATVGE